MTSLQQELREAIEEKNVEKIRWCFENGAKPNFHIHGNSPLAWSAYYGPPEMVQLFLEMGCPIQPTAFYGAKWFGRLDNAKLIQDWMDRVKVPTLRSLALRTVRWASVDTEGFPKLLLQFPDEVEESKVQS